MTRGIHRLKPTLVALAGLSLAIAGVACGDFTGVPASLATLTQTGTVYAINGAPFNAPTALHVFSGTLLPATSSFVFDIAFDLDAAGNAVLIPQRVIATGLTATHTVAMQKITGDFDALTSAPKSGYHADTSMVVALNQVVAIQSSDPNACGVSLTGSTLYAKLVVTAIDRDAKQLTVLYTVDPNCGFFSFASGLPKD